MAHGGALDVLGDLPRPALLALMRRAGIFVSPALYEPFGLTALEAGAAGCALVLSDIPTFRELWDGAAVFVDPRDPEGIGHALARLCEDAPQRRALQAAALSRARGYTAAAMAERYRETYERLRAPAFGHAAPVRAPVGASL
jgi:glycosyltransferase involved in cell wall biosynthesis